LFILPSGVGSRYSSVSILTRLLAARPRNRSSKVAGAKVLLSKISRGVMVLNRSSVQRSPRIRRPDSAAEYPSPLRNGNIGILTFIPSELSQGKLIYRSKLIGNAIRRLPGRTGESHADGRHSNLIEDISLCLSILLIN